MDKDLEYVIHHVFLPPKLPERDDSSSKNDLLLTQLVKDALKSAAARLGDDQCPSLSSMLNIMLYEGDGPMSTIKLSNSLKSMKENGKPSIDRSKCMADYSLSLKMSSPSIFEVRMPALSYEDRVTNTPLNPSSSLL
jgi:hypothetical protein